PGKQEAQVNQLLDEDEYLALKTAAKEANDQAFQADIGAPAVRELLRRIDVDKLTDTLRADVVTETSQHRKKMLLKRLKIVDAFRNSAKSAKIAMRRDWSCQPLFR